MSNLRPFYFFVVVWGKQFRDYLTDYCIPSLLAPNNIPALQNNQQNKLLICTTKEDWEALLSTPILNKLKTYIEPIFLRIPLPPEGTTPCQHMGVGHRLATELCFNNDAYGIALTPDLLISDGTLTAIQKHALEKKQVVFCAAFRFAEEPFFKGLNDMGIRAANQHPPSDKALIVTSRQLVQLCLQSFHSETETYNFESHYFNINAPVALWRLPMQQGLLIHSLSWCPLLIDYGAIKEHDTTALEKWTMDGDYIYKNFKDTEKIYTCRDSDEIMLLSWSPLSYQPATVKPGIIRRMLPSLCRRINRRFLNETLKNPIFDPLKLKLFPLPVRWHTEDINETWKTFEARNNLPELIKTRWSNTVFHYSYLLARFTKGIIKYSFLMLMLCLGHRKAREKFKTRMEQLCLHLKE